MFEGFEIEKEPRLSSLQYRDDTVYIEEGPNRNERIKLDKVFRLK